MGNGPLLPGQLPYLFHWDKNFGMDLVHNHNTYYVIFASLTIHPLVLYLLIWESGSLSKEIRFGYIANQVSLIIFEWIYGILIKIYPLCPYPALHCGGLLCGKGIHPQILLAIMAFGVVIPSPPFEYLLLMMHQKLVNNTASKMRLSKRTQSAIVAAITLLLIANVVGFGYFGRRTKKADEILNRPELAWLESRGGEIFIFGDIADPEFFSYECAILGASVCIILPYVAFFSWHMVKVIESTKSAVNDETVKMQLRMINILQYQFYGVTLCYATPCAMVFLGIQFGTMGFGRPHYIAVCRWLFTMIFIMEAVPLSLIFLLKNQTYRKIMLDKLRRLIHKLTPWLDRSVVTVQNIHAPFSNFPSSSITRATDVRTN